MLKLLYSLTGERLLAEIQALARTETPSRRICFVIANPLLHAALEQQGRAYLPEQVEFVSLSERVRLAESPAQVLVVDGEPKVPVFRTLVRCSPEYKLVVSPARAILTVLEHYSALHLVEAFDGPMVTRLRNVLREQGINHFVEYVLCCVEGFNSGRPPETARLGERTGLISVGRSPEAPWGGALVWDDFTEHSHALFDLLERLRQCQDPHVYLKALLSYFAYLKSNKNASKASKDLNISRTTLHDHLRLAEEFRISGMLESLNRMQSSSAG